MIVEVRDENGRVLPDQTVGKVWCTGPSLMTGYYRDPEATAACMADGWLDTGDMGYMSDGYVYIVRRAKALIIINVKNPRTPATEVAVEHMPAFKSGDMPA